MRVSCVLHHPDDDRHNLAAPPPNFTPIGMAPIVQAVRDLLEAAGEARKRGDHGAAAVMERDAALVLRAAEQDARAEARA